MDSEFMSSMVHADLAYVASSYDVMHEWIVYFYFILFPLASTGADTFTMK